MEKILVSYGEIGLKGKNKPFFLNRLKGNIAKSCIKESLNLISIRPVGSSFLCEVDNSKEDIISCFRDIFGIKHFLFVCEIEKDSKILFEKIKEICNDLQKKGVKFIFPKTKRTDKNFDYNSPEINGKIRKIAQDFGIEVDYKNCENMLYVRINPKSIFLSFEKILGPGGLPVGTCGRVLVLLSGGIDSPVAAWSLMRRGCNCDFLHLHNLKDNSQVLNSKIERTIKKLNKFQFESRLYTLPYETFEFSIMGKVVPRYELVIFKYYLLKLAETIALEYDYLAIANGDALAQVASQTIENINVVNYNINLPIFRPLLTFEKEEIITLANKIKTFNLSCETYKDCCSLVAKNPMTKAKSEKFLKSLENLNIDELINKSIKELEIFKI